MRLGSSLELFTSFCEDRYKKMKKTGDFYGKTF